VILILNPSPRSRALRVAASLAFASLLITFV
jgi:hypothetical protein